MPILFICGDSEGQDELVGRQLMYHSIQDKAHICRYCGISYDNTNNPYMRASETMARAIKNYISTKNHSKLKMIGYLLIDRNALHQVEFVTMFTVWTDLYRQTYSIHGSLACISMSFKVCLDQRKPASAQLKKRNSKVSDIASTSTNESVGVQGQNLMIAAKSTGDMFNSSEKDKLDNHTRFFGKALTRQSDRNLPRCYFPGGITGDKKKNGFEMQGVVLNVLCVFMSHVSWAWKILWPFRRERLGDWILVLEQFLMVEEFLKQKSFLKIDVQRFRKWFPAFLGMVKNVVDWQSSTGFIYLNFISPLILQMIF
jgi:hypothetical protein